MMTTKAEKLNELIDKIPGVCADGRVAVRNLVAEMTGETLIELPVGKHRIGDRFKFKGMDYIIAVAESGLNPHVVAVNLRTGARRGSAPTKVRSLYEITDEELKRIFRVLYLSRIIKVGHSDIPRCYRPRPIGENWP